MFKITSKEKTRPLLMAGYVTIITAFTTSGGFSWATEIKVSELEERFDCMVPLTPMSGVLTRVRVYTNPHNSTNDLGSNLAQSVMRETEAQAAQTHQQELNQIRTSQDEVHIKEVQVKVADLKEVISKALGYYAGQTIQNLKLQSELGFVAIGNQVPTAETLLAADLFVTSENKNFASIEFKDSTGLQTSEISTVKLGQIPVTRIGIKNSFGEGTTGFSLMNCIIR